MHSQHLTQHQVGLRLPRNAVEGVGLSTQDGCATITRVWRGRGPLSIWGESRGA